MPYPLGHTAHQAFPRKLQLYKASIRCRISQKRQPQHGAAAVWIDGPLRDYLRVGAECAEGQSRNRIVLLRTVLKP